MISSTCLPKLVELFNHSLYKAVRQAGSLRHFAAILDQLQTNTGVRYAPYLKEICLATRYLHSS